MLAFYSCIQIAHVKDKLLEAIRKKLNDIMEKKTVLFYFGAS
jgi:hypothetical protein